MEEKKVDEKKLEEVSGGVFNYEALKIGAFSKQFAELNCFSCAKNGPSCPYGGNGDKIYEVYGPGNYTCNERVAK